jgi:succinate dehydrogenase / fumarate reductase cytochrome b subunit
MIQRNELSDYLRTLRFPGMLGWVLHRITGVALALYLLMHFYVLSTAQKGREVFNALMESFETPAIKIFEIFLLFGVVYHTLNGIRLLLFDIGIVKGASFKWLFWVFLVISLGLVGAGGYYIWK